MKKVINGLATNLPYFCLAGVIVFGLITIVGSNGGGEGDGTGGDGTTPGEWVLTKQEHDSDNDGMIDLVWYYTWQQI